MKTKQINKKIRSVFVIGGLASLCFLTQLHVLPVSATDDPEEPTLTINTTSDTANLDLTPTGTDGTFATSANSDIVFNVSTNNFSGYSLSVTTNDNSSSLVSSENTISSINSALTANEFNNAAYNNKWGFRPSKFYDTTTNATIDNSGEDGVFLPAPTSSMTLDKTAAANPVANSYSISVGLRASLNTNAGEYNGSLNIVSVANPVAYIINFDNNTTETETVTNFPESLDNTTFGSSITLPDNTPVREHYSFTGWCDTAPANNNGIDTCSGEGATTYQPGDAYNISHLVANNSTLYAMWQIDTFTQTTKYRYENIDGTFTDWIESEAVSVNYGDTYTWDPIIKIEDFDGTPFEDNIISYEVTETHENEVTFMRHVYTITKRYKLEDADGNYPDEFTADGTTQVHHGGSFTYGRSIDYYDYKETVIDEVVEDMTLDLLLERKKYSIYVQAGNADIATVSESGSYRWGSTITVTANNPADNNCKTYTKIAWTRTGYGNYANGQTEDTGGTVQYEVGKGTATLKAWGAHDDIPQTITFSAPNGETITFDGVDYQDGDSTQAYCGTYDISSTIKEQPVEERIYLQDITPATCPTTKTRVYDRRDNESYYIQKLADGNCWLLDNLRLDSATTATLDTSNTNMSPVYNFELPESWPINSGYSYSTYEAPRITTNFKNEGLASWWQADSGTFTNEYNLNAKYTVEDSATVAFAEVSRIGVYYNFCAATAGTSCEDHDGNPPEGFVSDGNTYDICPAGWRIPTGGTGTGEYADLRSSYGTIDEFQDALNVRLGSGMVNGVNTQWHPRYIGFYWSSSVYATIYAYYLSTWDYGRAEDAFHNRDIGHAVRCMMQIPTEP